MKETIYCHPFNPAPLIIDGERRFYHIPGLANTLAERFLSITGFLFPITTCSPFNGETHACSILGSAQLLKIGSRTQPGKL